MISSNIRHITKINDNNNINYNNQHDSSDLYIFRDIK